MGQNKSTERNAYQYTYIKTINDEALGQIQIGNDLTHARKILLKNELFIGNEQMISCYGIYQRNLDLTHQNVANVLAIRKKTTSDICSIVHKITKVFEKFDTNLHKVIQQKKRNNQRFDENELWNLLLQLANGLKYLYQRQSPHEDIRPIQIQVIDDNCFVIYDNFVLADNKTNQFTVMKDTRCKDCFLAPEVFKNLGYGKSKESYNLGKADVFSLGMTLLSASLIDNVQDVYNKKAYQINYKNLERKLSKVGQKYSKNFYLILRAMMQKDPRDRLNPVELDQILWDADQLSQYLNSLPFANQIPQQVLEAKHNCNQDNCIISQHYPNEPFESIKRSQPSELYNMRKTQLQNTRLSVYEQERELNLIEQQEREGKHGILKQQRNTGGGHQQKYQQRNSNFNQQQVQEREIMDYQHNGRRKTRQPTRNLRNSQERNRNHMNQQPIQTGGYQSQHQQKNYM